MNDSPAIRRHPSMFPVLIAMLLLFAGGAPSPVFAEDRRSTADYEDNPETAYQYAETASESEVDEDFEFLEEAYPSEEITVFDPLEPWNRFMFQVNDRLYFRILKPTAQFYGRVVPLPARRGIDNFFHNIKAPIRLVNCVLQGKARPAMGEFFAFFINSTIGVLGFMDPAQKYPGLDPPEEDMGQTLGTYGIGNGIYLVWPLIGPSTLRDSFGFAADRMFLNPIGYIESTPIRIGLTAENAINATSLRIGDYESLKEASLQPYQAFKNAYIQYRKSRVQE
ncbi:MAG: VacJ family lipoprotein [Desulfobacterales bacterium]